ncbi:serine/threonine protein kinase [Streptomyces sp. M2CJ-2]|uniref:serine/threonine-protein kinase n=1 Tax=Streptomyces sp. M2CJ-2 TaxID=2803948 RepID=UPI001920FCFA|nr:serine/threonine-protein kinase [Streptomyces sp. M2CJ-2]MBL3664750.1 serine/threonine protein kinase [Streptomyces sp. M2CJ-2]
MSENGSGGRVQPARPGDPSRIGHYRIVGRLGAGGMGTVHAGVAPDGTRVAVKVIHPEQAQDPEFRARFKREVELSSRVTGPYLVPLLTADTNADTPWLATAYVPGPTLHQHLLAHGPLSGGSLYALAAATAQALEAVHAAGVVHRDVKPQNVILTPGGPRVLDFGIAHAADGTSVTRTGVMTGTPGWISPEHYRTGTTGPESDVFAWGALLAYASTGRLPFGAGAPDVVAFRVMSGEPDLDGVPAPLRQVVEKALSKEPGDRPSAAEAARGCAELLASQVTQVVGDGIVPPTAVNMVTAVWDVPAGDDPAWQLPPSLNRSRKQLVGAVALVAAVVGGLAGGAAALMPGGTGNGNHASPSAASVSPVASAGSGQPSVSTADDSPTKQEQQATADGSASAESWRQARTARGQGEHDVARAVLHDQGVTARDLSPIEMTPRAVRFHESRREVYFSYRLASDEEGMAYAETEIARSMCLTLRDVVLRLHPDLPYRTYVMVKEEPGRDSQVTWQEDFVADTECSSAAGDGTEEVSGAALNWEPDGDGLAAAVIPSTDRAEIRIADRVAKKIIERTNGMRPTLGTQWVLGHDDISVGFDPANSAMYVWSNYLMWKQRQKETWAAMAAGEACRALVRERESAGTAWSYSRYVVAEVGASGYAMIRWGSTTTEADCPA